MTRDENGLGESERGYLLFAEWCIAVALDGWKPTRGTRVTGQRNPGKRFMFSNGRLQRVDPPAGRKWVFPAITSQMADEHTAIREHEMRRGGAFFVALGRMATLAVHVADLDGVVFRRD
jgi:hypothetical protein